MKKRWFSAGLVLALGVGNLPSWGQVVGRERDVTITGPRGRTVQRSISSERGPGFVNREVTIQRPGGTFQSSNTAQRIAPRGPAPYAGRGYVPTGHHGGGGYGPRGPVIVERNVFVNNNRGPGWGPALAVGGGLFGLGMFAGSALASAPPTPVFVAQPAPVYMAPAPPPTVIYNAPQPYTPVAQAPATVVVDPVANAVGRLQSNHGNSRIEGAYTLGRLRDARAVPALVDRLKNDWDKDVRVAAANALGEIGDPRATESLRQAVSLDKRQAVRDAAGLALGQIASGVPTEVHAEPALGPGPGASAIRTPAQSPSPTSARYRDVAPPIEEQVPPDPTPSLSLSPGFSGTP
ncbi:HEAT repeat-containing protein [Singulisphaera sp. GP187]|uniref:HEAT repeat domain-containing protein n=1 Tax=Singulisphaera sp. GP187 TaxID=1882752 RepID=UPI0009281123|nr:HEAT repeat domain-containing protein [Singulisphaera sp. GP187]SIO66291.1 HEAT repeat-containing protein [Singulisphaera sp. GP187]